MLAETTKAIVEILKLAPRYLAALCIISGFLILSPPEWLSVLGLDSIVASHRPWVGLALLVSTAVCLVSAVIWLMEFVRRKWRDRSTRQYIVAKLHSLTEDEKQILRYYVAKNTRANSLRVDDGIVQELVASRIIYRSAAIGDMLEGFAHNISDFAWDYLHANRQLLAGSTNTYRTDKCEREW